MTICDLQQKNIISIARKSVGSPFRHQGRNPATGLDCVGLIVHVAKELGVSDFDRADYRKIPGRQAISRYAGAAGYKIRTQAHMRPGDIVILRFGRFLEHGAILTERGLIHACEKYGRVVEHGLTEEWQARIMAVYSFPAISHDEEGTL